jgi:hypothetical protein
LMHGIYPERQFEAWSCAESLHVDPWIQGTCLSTIGCISLWCAGQDCSGMCFSACRWKLSNVGPSAKPARLRETGQPGISPKSAQICTVSPWSHICIKTSRISLI